MSYLLDTLCGADRLAVIAKNEAAMDIVTLYDGLTVSEFAALPAESLEPSDEVA